MANVTFTIGHSNQSEELFAALLALHRVDMICDVRSQPYSRLNPQFNREELRAYLDTRHIGYVFLGKELGARSDVPSCYVDGRVDFDRLAKTKLFQAGISRVIKGAESYRLAIMCAEKEPLDCHRTILVARYAAARGLDVQHIHANGSLESHSDAIERLIAKLGIPQLFMTPDEVAAEAYKAQGRLIAYALPVDEKVEIDWSPHPA